MFHRCKTLSDADKLLGQLHEAIAPHHGYLRELLNECYLDFKAFGNPERIPKAPQAALEPPGSPKIDPPKERVPKGDSRLEIIPRLISAAAAIPGFDMGFINSVAAYLEKTGSITEKQYNALVSTETRMRSKYGDS